MKRRLNEWKPEGFTSCDRIAMFSALITLAFLARSLWGIS